MPNLKFSFLYRDAANYKTFGDVVFANPDGIDLEAFKNLLLKSCNPDGCFDPPPLPKIPTQPYHKELNHHCYEFESVQETEKPATATLSLTAFLELVEANPQRSPI